MHSNPKYSQEETWHRISHYCAVQERSTREVSEKLYAWGVRGQDAEKIIDALVDDNFVNNARFAEAFTRSKFNQKKWGKRKISWELRGKGVSDSEVRHALEGIPEAAYRETAKNLIEKKHAELKDEEPRQRKEKLMRYLASKGYESEFLYAFLPELEDE